jgi:hypothetical protein
LEEIVFYLDVPASPSLKIKAGLEEFRIILASKQARLFDIQVQGFEIETFFVTFDLYFYAI